MRNDHLRRHSAQARKRGAEQQLAEMMGGSADRQPHGGQHEQAHDQPPPFQAVAQRHDQQQTGGVSQLRNGHHPAHLRGADLEHLRQQLQQWLRVIVAGDDQAGGRGQQQYPRVAERHGAVGGGGHA